MGYFSNPFGHVNLNIVRSIFHNITTGKYSTKQQCDNNITGYNSEFLSEGNGCDTSVAIDSSTLTNINCSGLALLDLEINAGAYSLAITNSYITNDYGKIAAPS
jgi:hypothetical protein